MSQGKQKPSNNDWEIHGDPYGSFEQDLYKVIEKDKKVVDHIPRQYGPPERPYPLRPTLKTEFDDKESRLYRDPQFVLEHVLGTGSDQALQEDPTINKKYADEVCEKKLKEDIGKLADVCKAKAEECFAEKNQLETQLNIQKQTLQKQIDDLKNELLVAQKKEQLIMAKTRDKFQQFKDGHTQKLLDTQHQLREMQAESTSLKEQIASLQLTIREQSDNEELFQKEIEDKNELIRTLEQNLDMVRSSAGTGGSGANHFYGDGHDVKRLQMENQALRNEMRGMQKRFGEQMMRANRNVETWRGRAKNWDGNNTKMGPGANENVLRQQLNVINNLQKKLYELQEQGRRHKYEAQKNYNELERNYNQSKAREKELSTEVTRLRGQCRNIVDLQATATEQQKQELTKMSEGQNRLKTLVRNLFGTTEQQRKVNIVLEEENKEFCQSVEQFYEILKSKQNYFQKKIFHYLLMVDYYNTFVRIKCRLDRPVNPGEPLQEPEPAQTKTETEPPGGEGGAPPPPPAGGFGEQVGEAPAQGEGAGSGSASGSTSGTTPTEPEATLSTWDFGNFEFEPYSPVVIPPRPTGAPPTPELAPKSAGMTTPPTPPTEPETTTEPGGFSFSPGTSSSSASLSSSSPSSSPTSTPAGTLRQRGIFPTIDPADIRKSPIFRNIETRAQTNSDQIL